MAPEFGPRDDNNESNPVCHCGDRRIGWDGTLVGVVTANACTTTLLVVTFRIPPESSGTSSAPGSLTFLISTVAAGRGVPQLRRSRQRMSVCRSPVPGSTVSRMHLPRGTRPNRIPQLSYKTWTARLLLRRRRPIRPTAPVNLVGGTKRPRRLDAASFRPEIEIGGVSTGVLAEQAAAVDPGAGSAGVYDLLGQQPQFLLRLPPQ